MTAHPGPAGWNPTANAVRTFDVALRTRDRGTWRTFSDPVAVLQAFEPDDVPGCLAAIDSAVEGGAYAAGFLAYEAAAAFGLPTGRRRAGFLPLVCFGIYPPEHVGALAPPSPRDPYRLGAWRPSLGADACAAAGLALAGRGLVHAALAFRVTAAFEGEPRTVMADFDAACGGRMSAFVDAGTHAICTASPELLVAFEREAVECRPVSGRYSRGLSAAADRRHAGWLRDSESGRAEHAAIVDTIRAALASIADPATIEWRVPGAAERSPIAWQIASTVAARVDRPALAPLVAALFPAPSITGVPKPAAMAALKGIEPDGRGIHTGAIGYVSPRGRGQLAVAQHAIVIDRERREAEMGV